MANKETVEVVIDSNEASQKPELVEILALHEDVEDYKIKPLSEGDIIVGNCIFERKTPSDFASSLQEGRLRDQVERMAGGKKVPFILIEGDMKDFDRLKHTQIESKSLRGMDASIEMKNGVGVKYCSSIEYVADVAVRLSRKEKEDVQRKQARQTEAIKDTTFLEDVFIAIDGVGVKTAEKLSCNFESLSDALNASCEEFQEVEDVGEVTAEEIHSTLHQQHTSAQEEQETNSRVYNL